MAAKERIRVLTAKLGVDVHWRATAVVSQIFRDAGMEVIYLGSYITPENVVEAAIDEDVDVIALSSHCNYHMVLYPKLLALLKERGREDMIVVSGGVIPDGDKKKLEDMGITGNFGSGTPPEVIVNHVRERVRARG